jgi:hypothetical protein
MRLEELKNKKVLILGLGREGKDTFKFLSKIFPEKTFGIADKDKNCELRITNYELRKIRWHLGENYLKALKDYDVIIKSPGVPIHLPEVERAFREGKITSQTEIFFENYKGKIVGITGTKGKSTTASLIYKVLKEGGLKVHLAGNIGKPVLNYLISSKEDEVFVYELSSHQLYNLKISPHIAVFLNIYPEHLDYYKDFNEYLMAKANITLCQTENDFLVYNFKDKNVRKIAEKSKAKKIPIKDHSIVLKKIGIKKIPFYGEFYGLNIACAIEVGKIFGVKKKKVVYEEWSHYSICLRYKAGAMGIPFIPTFSMLGSDLLKHVEAKEMICPFTGQKLCLIPAMFPDVAVIHVHRADPYGNAQIDGLPYADADIARAASKVILTVEKIISNEQIRREPWRTVIPFFCVDAVVEVPYGAYPHECYGIYEPDYKHFEEYTKITREKGVEGVKEYLDRYVYEPETFEDYLSLFGLKRILERTKAGREVYL